MIDNTIDLEELANYEKALRDMHELERIEKELEGDIDIGL